MGLSAEPARLPKPGTAPNPRRRRVPGPPLLLRQHPAPRLRDRPERPPRPPAPRRPHVFRNHIAAPAQLFAPHIIDKAAVPAASRNANYCHVVVALQLWGDIFLTGKRE